MLADSQAFESVWYFSLERHLSVYFTARRMVTTRAVSGSRAGVTSSTDHVSTCIHCTGPSCPKNVYFHHLQRLSWAAVRVQGSDSTYCRVLARIPSNERLQRRQLAVPQSQDGARVASNNSGAALQGKIAPGNQ